ncbi:PAS domain-containing protein [Candidatus Woesearchaeota archaeon]|nr:PAS domain-containing protein [Candidatus Woesearchaeota archaeon]MCF7901261.1 PAS domain-containing protein [Candidatus Woesearchaeota archaeon]MCF8013572.1 PAS domain-containing protein [Candidatus Woesearchaeota archaeon]
MEKYQEELRRIKEILKEHSEGLSVGEISNKINVNRNSVAKYLDVLQISGYVNLRKIGPAKLFYTTNKVPVSSIMDSSDELIFILDENFYICQMNKVSKKYFGINNIKKNISIKNLINDSNFIGCLEKRKSCEIKIKNKILNFKFIESTFDDGSPGLTIIGEDVTKSKHMVEELELLKMAVESSSSGITIADATKKDLPLIYVNPGFENLTGYASKDILGKNCRFLQGDEKNQKGLVELRRALFEKRDCVVELKNFRKDGSMFWNELRISPVKNKEGVVTHFIGVQTDITHKKR